MDGGRNIFSRAGRWYEGARWPGAILVALIVAGYAWTLGWGPMIDDFRLLRVMRNYHEGRRSELGLYRFLVGGVENRVLRAAGYYPWWVGDDVRYQHARPMAERWLYGQFLLFGERTIGHRAVSLAMYAIGVLIVLRLFRLVLADERTASWAALIYGVAASHAVAVGFISMQCDLLGLLLVGGAMCLAVRYALDGGWGRLLGGVGLYALALGAKESSLPAAALPALSAWASLRGVRRGETENRLGATPCSRVVLRRGAAATGAMLLVGAAWLAMYARGGYGANNAMMLDPLRESGHYFTELWTRAGVLMATWLIPVNPFLFYLRPFGEKVIPILACAGVLTLGLFAMLCRRHGARAVAWAIWALAFVPLLACTPPDDRNLMLPSIGFAALAALWMTGNRGARDDCAAPRQSRGVDGDEIAEKADPASVGGGRLRRIPLFLFIALQVPAGAMVLLSLRHVSKYPAKSLEAGLATLDRPMEQGDSLIFVNAWDDGQLLFSQDCMDYLLRRDRRTARVRVAFLCDIREPRVTRVDDRTVRIEGVTENLLAGFIGKMGRTRSRDHAVGDEYDAGEFIAEIVEMRDGQIRAVEFRFKRPLDDPAYRFLRCGPGGAVERVDMSDG